VGHEDRPLPLLLLEGVLRHRRALVLRDVPEAEREPTLAPEPLRALLVRADARAERELALVDRLLGRRRGELDVTGHKQRDRTLPQQFRGARLRLRVRRLDDLGVALDDLELR